jgi:DNA-binding response OmpR family regulator
MGGSLELESRPGEGTLVSIAVVSAGTRQEREPPPLREHAFGAVLLVDDDPLVRSLCSDILGDQGFRVFPCADGASARALFERTPERFALAILDERIPGETGSSLARRFLRLSGEIRILLMSGMPIELHHGQKSLTDSRLRLLQKPFGTREFSEMVEGLLYPVLTGEGGHEEAGSRQEN